MNRRRGTIILMLLIAIMIAGIIAMRLIPSVEIQERREKGVELKLNLAKIRQAFAMQAIASPGYSPDLSTPDAIARELQNLARQNYLPTASLKDPNIPAHRWGTGSQEVYWLPVTNILQNSSIEILDANGFIASWQSSAQTCWASDTIFLESFEIEDFAGENKLGSPLGFSGKSLRIDN